MLWHIQGAFRINEKRSLADRAAGALMDYFPFALKVAIIICLLVCVLRIDAMHAHKLGVTQSSTT